MQPAEQIPQDYIETAEKIRSGEFFRESRTLYDFTVHDPMSERYLYLLITVISIFSLVIAMIAAQGLQPLKREVPFAISTTNLVDELPHIQSLLDYKGEDPNQALLRFMVENYVVLREEYNIDFFDRNVSGVKSQSSEDVYKEMEKFLDPRNPDSPITLYQRHSKRKITLVSSKPARGDDSRMEVTFMAAVEGKGETKRSYWQATLAFQYNGITIENGGEKITPPHFIVTQYTAKRFQDVK